MPGRGAQEQRTALTQVENTLRPVATTLRMIAPLWATQTRPKSQTQTKIARTDTSTVAATTTLIQARNRILPDLLDPAALPLDGPQTRRTAPSVIAGLMVFGVDADVFASRRQSHPNRRTIPQEQAAQPVLAPMVLTMRTSRLTDQRKSLLQAKTANTIGRPDFFRETLDFPP